MTADVLVLNATYEPLNRATLQRALKLILSGKAEIVSAKTGAVRSIRVAIPLPSVIRLFAFIRRPRMTVPLTKANLFRRDEHRCQYCGARENLTIDHIIPRSRGGAHSWKNAVASCGSCNTRKDNRTPAEAGMKLLRTPREPHFVAWLNLKIDVPTDWHAWFFTASAHLEERIGA